ncbi:hypothetical protein [Ideonella sp.]|uniref:hypothetical protein n=1 Tax=Ideonella sp. TaxID=1929293 RepID=UPI003BB7E06F
MTLSLPPLALRLRRLTHAALGRRAERWLLCGAAAAAGLMIGWAMGWAGGVWLASAGLLLWFAAQRVASRHGLRQEAVLLWVGVAGWTVAGMGWSADAVRAEDPLAGVWRLAVLVVLVVWHGGLATFSWWLPRRWLARRGPADMAAVVALCLALAAMDALKQWGWTGHGYAQLASLTVDLPGAPAWLPRLGGAGVALMLSMWCAWLALAPRALLIPVALLAGWGLGAMPAVALPSTAEADAQAWPLLQLRAVQAPQGSAAWSLAERDARLERLHQASALAPAGSVLVAAEGFLAEAPPQPAVGVWADLLDALAARQQHLLIGMPAQGRDGDEPVSFTALWQFSPGRSDLAAKQRLVPGGEYLPWPAGLAWLWRHVFASAKLQHRPGPDALTRPLHMQGSELGVLVCHELSLNITAAERAQGAQWLLNPSDEQWLASPLFRHQMQALARLRALEFQKPLLRVLSDEHSVLVSPDGGAPVVTAPVDAAALVHWRLQPREARTPAERHAEITSIFLVLLPWLSAGLARWRPARAAV